MNSFMDRGLGDDRPARIRYFTSDFEVLSPGRYVLCAVTGEKIPLGQLKYWNHITQEAYRDAVIATKRHEDIRAKADRN